MKKKKLLLLHILLACLLGTYEWYTAGKGQEKVSNKKLIKNNIPLHKQQLVRLHTIEYM